MKNSRVPKTVLSCFLILFLIQGILKICGVFVFEKTLDWEIFRLIENNIYALYIYHSLMNLMTVYALSFALTGKLYSKNIFIILLLLFGSFGVTAFKFFIVTPYEMEFIYDITAYILIPIIINIIANNNFKKFSLVYIAVQILLYFAYLGLCYWSSRLNSLIPVTQIFPMASTYFLICFEVYLGLLILMLALYIFIKENIMIWPANIASDIAKLKEKKEILEKELKEVNEKIEQAEKDAE